MVARILSLAFGCVFVATTLVSAADEPAKTTTASSASTTTAAPAPKYAALLKDSKEVSGMLTLHHKDDNVYAELTSGDYSSEYIVLISISRGISQGQLLGGMSWGFGDDWVWQFRKVGDNVHIVRKNVRFKANKGSPEANAVHNAYTDSVLFNLPIITKGPKGGDLVDITKVFMSDLPQISRVLPGFSFSGDKSSWAEVKAFEKNVELEVAATYASSGAMDIDTVPDSRGVTINVHYSLSKIPAPGSYQPRLADDRVGYFLTAVKDFSSKSDRDQFVRYINRWDLRKADESLAVSPPKQPIEFWIEKTVPYKYEKAITDGILEWNKAFEKAGISNAIVVKRQPDNADWDPEDVNYNTFRWITANAGFAMGPSRVNPYTGQILDADIIFDADFLTYWKEEFETMTAETIAQMTGGDLDIVAEGKPGSETAAAPRLSRNADCRLSTGMTMQLAFGSAAIAAANADPKVKAEELEKFVMQALKEVTMHEVGHTLGLRHNFKASKMLGIKEMQDPNKTKEGLVASVMDYSPANIVPKGWEQGDFFTTTLGPYDYWAIDYGYQTFKGGTSGEADELKKIASRSGEPQLAYATDEDTRGTDPDPDSNRFDMGSDPLEFAKVRMQMVNDLLPDLVARTTKDGDDYTQARRVFNILVAQRGQAMFFASRYIGGLKTSRSHKGDKDADPPVMLVDTKTQREALKLLEEQVFSDKAYQFSPEMFNEFGWSHWSHWGVRETTRKDFGIHDFVLQWQDRVLQQLLSSVTLKRMHDAEMKAAPDADLLTTAELLDRLTKSIFAEIDDLKPGEYSNREPAISSLRRNLQRTYLKNLAALAIGNGPAPQDCQTVAYLELTNVQQKMNDVLKNKNVAPKLDTYTKAHLLESAARIQKVLDARLTMSAP